jgi:hypothetical protein
VNEFFSHYVGGNCEKRVSVYATRTVDLGSPRTRVRFDVEGDALWLTPEQAKKIGRSMIKAAKWSEEISASDSPAPKTKT